MCVCVCVFVCACVCMCVGCAMISSFSLLYLYAMQPDSTTPFHQFDPDAFPILVIRELSQPFVAITHTYAHLGERH